MHGMYHRWAATGVFQGPYRRRSKRRRWALGILAAAVILILVVL